MPLPAAAACGQAACPAPARARRWPLLASGRPITASPPSARGRWLPWCATLWAVGVAVLSLRLLAGWTQVQQLRRRGTPPADGHWQARLEMLARRVGVRRTVRLLESALTEVPAVVGWLRPVVLVPVGVLTGLSAEQVEMILTHELAHIWRQDYLVNLGLTLFETFGFYHPAVWWIARCVRAEREHACDDLAVSACGGDRFGYVRALATLEEMRGPAGQFALAASGGGRGLLLARVRRLLGVTPERRSRNGRATWWLAGVIALLVALAITVGGVQRPAQAQGITAKKPSAGEQLRGLVVDENGKPVPGALVYDEAANDNMDPGLKEPVLSGADGSFRVPKLRDDGRWRVIAARLGDAALGWLDIGGGRAPAAFGADNVIVKPIVLRARRYRLDGVCVDERGQPVAGARIAVTDLPSEGDGGFTLTPDRPEKTITQFFDALATRSDAQGAFSLTVPVDDGMSVEISAPGRQTVEPFSERRAGMPETGDLGRITLASAGAIAGRIAFAEGTGGQRSLQGMILDAVEAGELRTASVLGPPEHTNEINSDEVGRYRIEHLPPGTYTVYLLGIDGQTATDTPTTVIAAENVVVRAGETTPLDLRAVVGRRLTVQAFDADTNRPVGGRPGVHIEGPSQPRSAGLHHSTALTEQGEWWFDVAPGHYRVFLTGPITKNSPELASAEADVPADHAPEPVRLKVTDRQRRLLGRVQDARGKPVPLGGTSTVMLFGTDPKWDYPLGGGMSSDGTFRIDYEKKAGGRVRVAVDVPGNRLWLSPEFGLTDQPEPVTATLESCDALTVRGRALDQDGRPVAHAQVIGKMIVADGLSYQISLGSGIPDRELFTDEDGRFETRRFRAGDRFRLFVDRPGMSVAASADWVQTEPSSQGVFNVEMHPIPVTRPPAPEESIGPRDLGGHVVDARGNPVAGAVVTVNTRPEIGGATTNAAGGFRFPDFGDRHYLYLKVEKAGFGTHWETDLAVGRDFTLRLDDTTHLRGQLVKPDGSPSGKAAIVLRTARPTRRPFMVSPIHDLRLDQSTDEHGAYDFPVEASDYEVEITSAGGDFLARHESVRVEAGQSGSLPATLEAGLSLRVQTVDSVTGKPAAGIKFSITEMTDDNALGIKTGSERQTDAHGFARWDHLFPGVTMLRRDKNELHQRLWTTDDRDQSPLKPPAGSLPTGSEGTYFEFNLKLVPERADEPMVVQAERGVKVSGQVFDARGKPAINVSICAMTDRSDRPDQDGSTADNLGPSSVYEQDGAFNVYIPAGNGVPTRLNARPQDDGQGVTLTEPFESRPGDERQVTIHLTEGGRVDGSVLDKQGNPLPNVNVAATPLDRLDSKKFWPWAKTDAQGHFRFEHMRPTEYEVTTTVVPYMSVGEEPPQEKTRITVAAGEHAKLGTLHFDPAGWTALPPAATPQATPTPTPTPAAEMRTARVKVVDESGRPIAGATITTDGLRTRADPGSFYGWRVDRDGPPVPAMTDADGIAAVRYPHTIDEKMAVSALSFLAEHPDYSATRPTSYAVVDNPAKAEPVVLRRGATLRIAGRLPGSADAVPVYPQQGDLTRAPLTPNAWKDAGGNVLETHQLPAGRSYLRLVHAAPDGVLYFSEARLLSAVSGETYKLDLELKPGVRVEGRLDPSVPRPVRGGRVEVHAYATGPESDANEVGWYTWRDVAADGTFVFESLPPGALEVTALCEGYTSTSLPDAKSGGSLHIPQRFDLPPGETTHAEVKMQAAAACTVEVRDEEDKPVSGAHVGFAPSVIWTPDGTSIFCGPAIKMEEFVTRWRENKPFAPWLDHHLFEAVSDDRGVATVRGLPILQRVMFGVTDDRYESFPRRDHARLVDTREGIVDLVSGGTATVAVRLTKKGARPPMEEDAAVTLPPAPTPPTPPPPPDKPSAGVSLAVRARPDATDTFLGRVIGEDGKGLPGVLVDAWTWCPGNEATTDADGNFQIKGLDPQRQIEVRFSKEGFTPRLVVKQPLGAMEQPLTMTNHTYFEGVVTGPDNRPAADAWIRANQGPKDADGVFIDTIWTETHADARGHYRLYAQDDRYNIQVTTREGNVARLPDMDLADGQARWLDIALQAGTVFRAKFVDSESGATVAGAKLSTWEQPGFEGVSAADGTLEIRGLPPGKFEFDVAAEGCTRWWSEQCLSEWSRLKREDNPRLHWQRNFDRLDFDLQPGLPAVTVTLERGVRIRGRSLDPDGRPVAGATVAPALTGTGNSLTGDTRFSVETRADGTFEMLLPASGDAEYNLEVHDGKYGEWRQWANGVLPPIKTQPGQKIDGLEIRLRRPAVVRGRALDSDGNPYVGQVVRASATDQLENRYYNLETTTDRDGRFELKFLRPGKQTITLEVPRPAAVSGLGRVAQKIVELPEDGLVNIELRSKKSTRLPETEPDASLNSGASAVHEAEVRGMVHDADGNPVVGAEVEPFGMGKGEFITYGPMRGKIDEKAITDAKGEFVLRHADPEGVFTVRVRAPGFARTIFSDLKVAPGPRTLVLKRGAAITGQALTAAGTPAANVKLTLAQTDRNAVSFLGLYETVSDAQGRFRFDGLGPGQSYDLFAPVNSPVHGEVLPARVVAAGEDGSTRDVGACQWTRGLRVSGRVKLADDLPLPPGSFLGLTRDHTWDSRQRVDLPPDGKFEFRDVPIGSIRFVAHVPGYDNLMKRTRDALRDQEDVLEHNPSLLLRDVPEYERSGRNWQFTLASDRDSVELLLHADDAIDRWLTAQTADWVQRVEANYPQGTAGMSRTELRELAARAQQMVGTPGTNSDLTPPVTWRFILSSEQEAVVAEIARRAKAIGFQVYATGLLTDLQKLSGLPEALRDSNGPGAHSFALEVRATEPPSAEQLFQHELALRRLMHECGPAEWRMTGRVDPTHP